MQTHETWQVVVRSAGQRAKELAAYLFNTPDDPQVRAELVRVARIMRGEGAARALDELERLAARVEALLENGSIGSRAHAELDAAVERLVVLADRMSQPGESTAESQVEDSGVEDQSPQPSSPQVGNLVRPPFG
jgi:hypothetical protein